MKKIFFLLLIGLLKTTALFSNNIWDSLINKTWFSLDEKPFGCQIVFYKINNGLTKAIRQFGGSGVYVIRSEIYDVEIKQDSVYLKGGLNLVNKEKLSEVSYGLDTNENTITKKGKSLEIMLNESVIYSWADRAAFGVRINNKLLFDIPIGEKEAYDLNQIKKISIPDKKE